MDDILKDEKCSEIDHTLEQINSLNPNLRFTIEREQNNELPVLDMKIHHDHETGKLTSTWYSKPTDTGLIMNYHALAPKRYKRSVVSGFVYRIHRACSSWALFHDSLEKAKKVLERNQYPPAFYEPIIKQTITTIIGAEETSTEQATQEGSARTPTERFPLKIQYRGKCSEEYARALHKINAPCMVVMTLRKLKTVLPSTKPPVEKMLKSGVVYKLTCPRCAACYVGQTGRHLQTRFQEHIKRQGPVKVHMSQCSATLGKSDVNIVHQTSRGEAFLLTLEALWIRELKPEINTKDEYRSRELTIKLLST